MYVCMGVYIFMYVCMYVSMNVTFLSRLLNHFPSPYFLSHSFPSYSSFPFKPIHPLLHTFPSFYSFLPLPHLTPFPSSLPTFPFLSSPSHMPPLPHTNPLPHLTLFTPSTISSTRESTETILIPDYLAWGTNEHQHQVTSAC